MSRMLWLADALREEGLEVVEVDGWQTRGYATMNPQVVVDHHTATTTAWSTNKLVSFIRDGRSDLAGPLSQLVLERTGVYYVVASGKANHAGRGSWLGISGNSNAIGIEAANAGNGEPWPAVQYDAYVKGNAALLRRIEKPAANVCGHKEWTTRKIDPYGLDMNQMRADVAEQLLTRSDVHLTPEEVRKLRSLIWSWEKVGSNPSFPIYTIQHTREHR